MALGRAETVTREGFNTYITAEHQCYPPQDGRDWTPVPSSNTSAETYICPECEQHFAPRDGR
jgi:hypothetical protein